MKTVLVIRLSSMGDVLLTIPVLAGVLENHPELRILLLTRERFTPYFKAIDRLETIGFDPENRHKGFVGILRLFKEIRQYRFSCVLDLHGVLRTYLLDLLLLFSFHKLFISKKYRVVRRKIVKGRKKLTIPHTTVRYQKVFSSAGFSGRIVANPLSHYKSQEKDQGCQSIGIAPIAKHSTKTWNAGHLNTLIHSLLNNSHIRIYLFGGKEDQVKLGLLSGDRVINTAGAYEPEVELALIANLDLFISMDSANMHLASLSGVPTISIWGATDPALGFSALNQPSNYSLFADPLEVPCRPCSVYGEQPCYRKDFPMVCMDKIQPAQVIQLAEEILNCGR